jgi:curved DNA-binding protein CbpA
VSAEQRNTFFKFRDADDAGGNLGWSSRMAKKAMRVAPAAPPDVEDWELSDGEKVIWRLIKIPRRYIDLENTGVLAPEKVRGFLRGLVSADVVDILEEAQAKPIVPIEIKRTKDKVEGKSAGPTKKRPSRLKARVYRPDISAGAADKAASPPKAEPPPKAAPKSVPQVAPPKAASQPAAKKEKAPARAQDVEELVVEIESRFEMMRGQTHYEFLEIQPSAQPEGIKKSYMKLAKLLHPDRIHSAVDDEEIIEKGDKLFKRLQNAWSTLNNEAQRRAYDEKVAAGAGGDGPGGKVRRPEEAKVMFLKAEHLAKAKQWQQAIRHYKTALQLDDSVMAARVGMAWAAYFDDAKDKDERSSEARRTLSDLANHHKLGDAAYKLALISRLEGNPSDHEKYVRMAARLDPRHQEAQQERRLLDRRSGGDKGKGKGKGKDKGKGGGLFGKLKR